MLRNAPFFCVNSLCILTQQIHPQLRLRRLFAKQVELLLVIFYFPAIFQLILSADVYYNLQ
jgi:hypothetical protein